MYSLLILCSSFLLILTGRAVGENSRPNQIKVHKIVDVDFFNTKLKKVCLLAEFDATIILSRKFSNGTDQVYSLSIPQDATTEGSFCNKEYTSQLQINFHESSLVFIFKRDEIDVEIHQATYCYDCDYGSWHLDQLIGNFSYMGEIIHGKSNVDQLKQHFPFITDGIGIRRAFRCDKNDSIMTLPIYIDKITDASTGTVVDTEVWAAEIRFFSIQVQPFLVYKEHFSDPYLCRDVTSSHILIILLPLVYFAIFILFHRAKNAYGCPPKKKPWSWKRKMPMNSSTELKYEIEESTNIVSGEFTSIPANCYSESD